MAIFTYNEVLEARQRGLEALRNNIRVTTNPFLIAGMDGIPAFRKEPEPKKPRGRPMREKRASFKTKG